MLSGKERGYPFSIFIFSVFWPKCEFQEKGEHAPGSVFFM